MTKYLAPVFIVAAAAAWSQAQAPAQNTNAPAAVPATAPATADAAKPAVKVEKIVVGTAINNREAMGTATSFGADVEQVYCWTKLIVAEPPAKIKYVWTLDGKQVLEHSVDVNNSGRYWASKKMQPGSWKVEVQTEGGVSLASAEFKRTTEAPVKAEAAPAPAAPVATPTK